MEVLAVMIKPVVTGVTVTAVEIITATEATGDAQTTGNTVAPLNWSFTNNSNNRNSNGSNSTKYHH